MFIKREQSCGVVKYKIFGKTIFKQGNKQKGPYGMHSILEAYTGLKINRKKVRLQHGWSPLDGAFPNDLKKKTKVALAWNKRYCNDWNKKSDVPCYIWGSPFIYYRKMNNIVQDAAAKGTIAYPSHSTATSEARFDIDEYCAQLKALPDEFQPVTISLHPMDIELYHMDEEYEKRGFKTVCAGLDMKKPFYELFYDNLKKYKYSTSNEPGSYTFYSVEMGIPFFILGPVASSCDTNKAEENREQRNTKITDYQYGQIAYDLFSKFPKGIITEEQRNFVLSETGANDCVSKDELIKILEKIK